MIFHGRVPVPFTASWTSEERLFLGECPHARRIAICQDVSPGVGKPCFGKPHMQRQREAIALGLCDLCGKSLKSRTKVSLSHARPRANGAAALDILQVEPLLHRECARESLNHCPSLRRDIKRGTLVVRQVTASRCQFAIFSAQGVFEAVGERLTAVSHAKVQLLNWIDRSPSWLGVDDR